ncbi:hypothetical protein GGI21_000333 [Coemansia aciculifera]|nr:hypothetical protein GGI21_000333 [Coemansia aciculifera]
MDDATVSATASATADGGLDDDFGLIDYESPGPEPLLSKVVDEPAEKEDANNSNGGSSSAADVLIDFEESDDDDDDDVRETAAPISPVAAGVLEEDDEDSHMETEDNHVAFSAGELEEEENNHLDFADGELEEEYVHVRLADAEQLEQSLYDSHLEPNDAEIDDAETEAEAVAETGTAPNSEPLETTTVPETWVFNDGEWMIYLGPNQHSYPADYQDTLFAMPLDQLISALHSDISLREDTELALEFPSLALTIDQRDRECAETSLAQIYNCHAAAVRLGRLSEDLVNSPYFAHSTFAFSAADEPSTPSIAPLPDSFAFIIHSRSSVHSSFKRLMQIVAEDAQVNSLPAPPSMPLPEEAAVVTEAVDVCQPEAIVDVDAYVNGDASADKDSVTVVDLEDAAEEPGATATSAAATTADLLADAGEDDDEEDDDEDYVAEGEEEGDFVLEDDDGVDEEGEDDEEEEEADGGDDDEEQEEDDGGSEVAAAPGDDDIEGIETRVESLSTSPTHKRVQDSMVDVDDEVVPDCDEPAAKKARSGDATVQGNGIAQVAAQQL